MPRIARAVLCVSAIAGICLICGACTRTRAASEPVPAKPQVVATVTPSQPAQPRSMRTLGTIAAQRALSVQVPRISGQGGGLTLVQLVANGAVVKAGDVLAEFDNTTQLKTQRDA